MKRFVFLLLGIVLFLTGCGPKEGDVIDKRIDTTMSCPTVGNVIICSESQTYYLILRTPDGKVKDKDVSKKKYYAVKVGDHYKEN